MATELITDEVIAERVVPAYTRRAHTRIELNGNMYVDDELQIIVRLQRAGETSWNVLETKRYIPDTNAPDGKRLTLVAEAAIYEVNA